MNTHSTIHLKFCLINAENLFLLFDTPPTQKILDLNEDEWQKLSSSLYENKPLEKTRRLAESLKKIDADIILLCEVGGYESLKNFNQLFLQDQYSVCLMEGNSQRNIDVGFLIRKGLDFYFDLQSNKNRPINYLYPHERRTLSGKTPQVSHKFSRDVAELKLFKKDREKPFLIVLLTHLKSRLDPERIDAGGFERRQAELKTLLEIYQDLLKAYPMCPMIVAGDFNGNASPQQTDEEFKTIYSTTDLKDVLDLSNIPQQQRITFHQVRPNSTADQPAADGRQLDYCFLNTPLQNCLKKDSAKVLRYNDFFGLPIDTPATLHEKLNMPSDH
ncbi:MAG: endonuclease/exonuclease/phosphatase family protein, partial [Pseudobdellovibrionaceae bacterium]